MDTRQSAAEAQPLDPSAWVDEHGDYLFRYAKFRVREDAVAEDIMQETLLAALQGYHRFAGRGSVRTWLVGILKHKITDYYRRASRETPASQLEGDAPAHDEFFRDAGEWVDHWKPERAPVEWQADPAELLRQGEFWEVYSRCLAPLPQRVASAFTMREVDGLTSEEICEVLSISVNNLWVMLHRARMHLRRCLELNWFSREAAKH
jgi:RNA polymerase sigma-70 factor, ECF subfamily